MKRMKVRESTPPCFNDDGRLVIVRREDTIWSPLRRMWLVETPEEHVRQEFLCVLVHEYGFKLEQIAEELEVAGRGSGHARADFVIWRTPQDKAGSKSPLIVVECKADNVTIDRAVYEQGENYSRLTIDGAVFAAYNRRRT